MKREIKFRLWNPKRKVLTAGLDMNTIICTSDMDFVNDFNKKGMIWMQYTGMRDRDGKEIYEGDIISFVYQDTAEETGEGTCVGIVVFEDGCFNVRQPGFDYKKTKEIPFDLHTWLIDDPCFIIGNIHQNPELLEVAS